EAAVIVAIAEQHPTLRLLACDVRLAGLALCVEAVELLLQALLRGFARVDGAALAAGRGERRRIPHRSPRLISRRPKKRQPFQRVPAIARAMAESDLYLRPSNSKPSRRTVTVCSTPFHSRTSRVPATGMRDSRIIALRPGLPCSSSARASSSRTVSRDGPPYASSWTGRRA